MDNSTLARLAQHLTEPEADRFRVFSTMFASKENSRIKQIFDLYRQNSGSAQSIDSLYEDYFSDISRKAFFMLQRRLAERLVEFCCLASNIALSKDIEFANLLELRRKQLQAEYLKQKGFKSLAIDWFEDVYTKADEIGYPDIALESLMQVRAMAPSEIEVDTARAQVVHRLLEAIYADTLNRTVFDTFNQLSQYSLNTDLAVDFLVAEIQEMLKRADKTQSPRAVFYAYYLAGIAETQRKNFSQAHSYFSYLQNWLSSRKEVGSKNRMAILLSQMGQLFLESAHYQYAKNYFEQSLSLYPSGSKNSLSIQLSLNLALFLQADFENLAKILTDLAVSTRHPEIYAIIAYQQASINFVQENYTEALKALEQADSLLKDKAGWNIGIRFMELLLLIEKEDFDLAQYKIDTLRKHVEKYLQKEERDYLRYKLLSKIIHESGDFKKVLTKYNFIQELFEKLIWKPNTYELIREDCWLVAKVRKEPYWKVFREYLPTPTQLNLTDN